MRNNGLFAPPLPSETIARGDASGGLQIRPLGGTRPRRLARPAAQVAAAERRPEQEPRRGHADGDEHAWHGLAQLGNDAATPSARKESCVAMKLSIAPFMWCASHQRASRPGASASRHMLAPKPDAEQRQEHHQGMAAGDAEAEERRAPRSSATRRGRCRRRPGASRARGGAGWRTTSARTRCRPSRSGRRGRWRCRDRRPGLAGDHQGRQRHHPEQRYQVDPARPAVTLASLVRESRHPERGQRDDPDRAVQHAARARRGPRSHLPTPAVPAVDLAEGAARALLIRQIRN